MGTLKRQFAVIAMRLSYPPQENVTAALSLYSSVGIKPALVDLMTR